MAKLEAFIKAKEKLSKVLLETQLIYSPIFSKESGNKVFIKPENLQKTGSFKIRGAYNKISNLTDAEKKRGVIASSAGNHAQGVAYGAKESGIKAVIVMPKSTPLIKVESTKQYGAEVILHGDVYDDAFKKAKELEEKEGYVFVHPFNDEDVLDGQGTIALEILEELPETDIILVPIGGGGLISGIACAAKILKPEIKIIGVEPEGAASAYEAIKENKVVELKEANTIADGTAVKKIGDLNFEYIKKYVDEIITVSDYELMEAFLLLVEKHKIIAENSGILSIAATKKLKEKNKKVVSVISGGNIDVLMISSMINKGLIRRDRIFNFTVSIPDKPGELAKVVDLIAEQGANVIKLEHNQFKNLSRFKDIELQITVETNGSEHVQNLTQAFEEKGYEIVRIKSKIN
ncbi:threonine ammonia-lyase [Fusobacterium nucleatum subsp. nucleatum ATCC 25586]|uniref:threonine ammonia-lyase n=1 Tax=Fusobacterium nucleatum subsp. nucleatum (strain ATCC 25586 / DSM 15643 / BCRC 10681 / CIP 101130 / JCM 8532 / KCTC 2640 / LMG 13131 / VPI 4355) TaxID=190304 RepID=Q8RDT9_FUSNN|nr:threonine ammonia-lyase [Fusobacterium nucleatum]AAL95604.1 Threonine dehydratase [Fusobacterium nucleatum subsp. nucleatum ATCC 25586]AVQ15707.1 threonine ammonia-lyase [Fusobacterium nucleatum subsp. nucleatum ATCC 25586]WMS28740.1 threonine ammonia-lyase [Fusobacterium nucleatum]